MSKVCPKCREDLMDARIHRCSMDSNTYLLTEDGRWTDIRNCEIHRKTSEVDVCMRCGQDIPSGTVFHRCPDGTTYNVVEARKRVERSVNDMSDRELILLNLQETMELKALMSGMMNPMEEPGVPEDPLITCAICGAQFSVPYPTRIGYFTYRCPNGHSFDFEWPCYP